MPETIEVWFVFPPFSRPNSLRRRRAKDRPGANSNHLISFIDSFVKVDFNSIIVPKQPNLDQILVTFINCFQLDHRFGQILLLSANFDHESTSWGQRSSNSQPILVTFASYLQIWRPFLPILTIKVESFSNITNQFWLLRVHKAKLN